MIERKEYQVQQRVSFLQLAAKLPNFALVTASALLTGSVLLWMDFIDSFGTLLNSFIMFLITRKLKNNLSFEFNYGIGKIEAVAAMFGDIFTLISLFGLLMYSVLNLLHPKQPSELLFYVIFLKIVNVAVDVFVYIFQKKRGGTENKIFRFEQSSAFESIAFDAGTLISVAVAFLFRDHIFSWYFSPIICIVTGAVFFAEAVRGVAEALDEILDKTLDEKSQLLILKALNTRYKQYRMFESVNSRRVGKYTHVDILLKFYDDTTYADIERFVGDIYRELRGSIPGCVVSAMITVGVKSERGEAMPSAENVSAGSENAGSEESES